MPIVVDNNFSKDSHGLRAERLNAIQHNFATIQPELQAPAHIETWAVDCYDVFLEIWVTAGTEASEKESAAIDIEIKGELMSDEYQNTRNLAMSCYKDDPVHFNDFPFDKVYPIRRNDQIKHVERVLQVHQRHVAEGITHLIPDVMITRLTNAVNNFVEAIGKQDEERAESEHATADLLQKMDSDGDMLRNLKSWWFAMMGKEDARIDYIGMVNPKYSTGGGQPGVPQNLAYDMGSGQFSWDAVSGATSYQLAYRATGSGNDLEEAYKGANTSVTFNPGNGNWEFKVRARNENGYGDWSSEITVTIGLQPPQIWELVYNPSTNKVTLQWHASIGADFHDVYQSVVPLGQGAEDFTMIQSVAGQVYQHDVTTYDVREYYYVIARNASGSSDPSEIVFVDVAAA